MNRKGGGKLSLTNLPVSATRGLQSNASRNSAGLKMTHSAEDIPKQVGSGLSLMTAKSQTTADQRRALSPKEVSRKSMISPVRPQSQASIPLHQTGIRYITEDLIIKLVKETNLDIITKLNLTLSKEGGKKIKYIENLDRLRKLQSLNLSFNVIEKMERLDKLLRLQELNLSNNMIIKIEGIENLTLLQNLNVSDNQIEHIPLWLSKKLKALRIFKIARNKLHSLSEVAKLKSLPDLIQLDVTGNHLATLPHHRLYIVFHLRSVEILDDQPVQDKDRKLAQERFSNDEVEQLEKKLIEEEQKYKQLQDSHSKSLQEKSLQENSQHQLVSKEKDLQEKLKQLEQELAAKDDLLKRKTSDLNKASQKHYQLEQELAFYKIDSKFDSLKEAPSLHLESGDDSSDLQESPYIGRARFRLNQYAQESNIAATPQKANIFSLHTSPGQRSSPQKEQMKIEVDKELERKQIELKKTEERLRGMQMNLSNTEKTLLNATTELKKIVTDRYTPEPFQDDSRYKLRQRLTRKMQKVNELRQLANHMESEIDRSKSTMVKNTSELQKLKSQLVSMDTSNPIYRSKQQELVEKDSQVNEVGSKVFQLKQQLEEAHQTIARETTDIKNLEDQLSKDHIDGSDDMGNELDDIVSGLTNYLENVKSQSQDHKKEVEMLQQEKTGLEEKIKHMEANLQKLEAETSNAKLMQMRLIELEDSLRRTEETKKNLQLNSSKQQELEDRMIRAESEAKQLRQTLQDNERKVEAERMTMQKQLQSERERVDKMTQKIQDVNRQELETKKILSQLESAKAVNAGLRDQLEEYKQKQGESSSFKPSELKKKLNKFTHDFKSNKGLIQPEGKNDLVGMAFQEIQKHAQEQMNSSLKEVEKLKKYKEQADVEIQTLKEKVKRTEEAIQATQDQDGSKLEEENKRLQDELVKLKKALEDEMNKKQEGRLPVRIVYRPDSVSGGDKASSLDSDEKQLFDELQRELLDLRRNMRSHENDLSRKLLDAESEAAHWKEEMKQKEKEFETEIEEFRQAAELLREKQEARIQVIAQDLDQAQFVADALQSMLEEREKALGQEFNNVGISSQMIAAQEEELVKLYDILEKQRDEIENLNQMLDHLAQQGPDGVGVGFDDELWRIRQEVNSLKETLAMQSAYVQAMPSVGHIGTQANGHIGAQVNHHMVGVGSDAVDGGSRHARNQPQIYTPWNPSDQTPRSKVSGSLAASIASTHQSTGKPMSGATTYSSRSGGFPRPGVVPLGGGTISSTLIPQSYGTAGEGQRNIAEHLGTERRESKNQSPSKTSLGRQGQSTVPKSVDRAASSVRSQQPVYSADRYPVEVGSAGFQPAYITPSLSQPVPSAMGYSNYAHDHDGDFLQQKQKQTLVGSNQMNQAYTSPEAVKGRQVHYGLSTVRSYPGALSQVSGEHEGVMPLGNLPQTIAMQRNAPQAHVSHRSLSQDAALNGVAHYSTGAHGTFPQVAVPYAQVAPGMEPQGHAMSHISGPYASGPHVSGPHVSGPHVSATYGGGPPPGAVPVYPVPMTTADLPQAVSSQQSVFVPNNLPGYQFGQNTYTAVGPVQFSQYGSRRPFVPAGAGHRGHHPARIYYPAQQSIPLPAPGGAPPPPPPGDHSFIYEDDHRPLAPLATGTPVHNGSHPMDYFDQSAFIVPPSPIRLK